MAARRRQCSPLNRLVPLLAWLAGLVAALQIAPGQDALSSTTVAALLVACALCAVAATVPLPGQLARVRVEPALDRLHGRFQNHSRPGVPGRVRARAPGR